jgi:ABC-2 type transport system ATP-binding protein
MLCTLLRPTEGSARVAGYDVITQPDEVRRSVGLVAEKIILYDRLTALENLKFFGGINQLTKQEIATRSDEWLKRLGMYEWKDKLAGTYSTGMQQRVNIARALLTQPTIMFLDEPTLGLDPQTTRAIRLFIRELADMNITVILTTHIMAEAEALCDRISIIDHGEIVALDTAANLKKLLQEGGIVLDLEVLGLSERIMDDLCKLDSVRAVTEPEAGHVRLTTVGDGALGKIVESIEVNGGTVKRANTFEPNLEDVFLHLTGSEIRAEVSKSASSPPPMPGSKQKRIR